MIDIVKARNNIKQFDCRIGKIGGPVKSVKTGPGKGKRRMRLDAGGAVSGTGRQKNGNVTWITGPNKKRSRYDQGPIFAKCALFVPARLEVPDRIQTFVVNGVQGIDDAVLEKDVGHGFPLIEQIH